MDITEYTDWAKELPETCKKTKRVCRRCRTEVTKTTTPDYSYYCPEHDEDLYEFETEIVEDEYE